VRLLGGLEINWRAPKLSVKGTEFEARSFVAAALPDQADLPDSVRASPKVGYSHSTEARANMKAAAIARWAKEKIA
jgi:hypothetical protein